MIRWLGPLLVLVALVSFGVIWNQRGADRAIEIAKPKPVVMLVQLYTHTDITELFGHSCGVMGGMFTFVALEAPVGRAFVSPAIFDWAVCTPTDVSKLPKGHPGTKGYEHKKGNEPSTLDSVDFTDFVRP